MGKRKKIQKYWSEKVAPNKRKIASRVIRAGAVYMITGLSVAFVLNATELAKGYVSCFGGKKFGSYREGKLCPAMLLTCVVTALQELGNPTVDAACIRNCVPSVRHFYLSLVCSFLER